MIKSFEREQSFMGKNFLQRSYRHLAETRLHTILQKVMGLLGYAGETIIRKRLLTSWVVKGEIPFGNSLGLLTQIDNFPSKCCILGENPKNSISGRTRGHA